jgi:hypothetical protein
MIVINRVSVKTYHRSLIIFQNSKYVNNKFKNSFNWETERPSDNKVNIYEKDNKYLKRALNSRNKNIYS